MKQHSAGSEWLDGWPFIVLALVFLYIAISMGAFR